MNHEEKIHRTVMAPVGLAVPAQGVQIYERPGWYQLLSPAQKDTGFNEVIHSVLESNAADKIIDETIAQYEAHKLQCRWAVTPLTRPRDMGERLERRGFFWWQVRGMSANPFESKLKIPSGITVRQVDENLIIPYCQTLLKAWNEQESTPVDVSRTEAYFRFSREKLPQSHYFLAFAEDEPVGTAGLVVRGDYAYLMGASVRQAFRRRGIYHALIEARFELLRTFGISLATTQAREDTSAPILEKVGFETLYQSRIYCSPGPWKGPAGVKVYGNAVEE